jgi:ribonuclease R
VPPKGPKKAPPFPGQEQILEFLSASERRVGKREIARAFHIRGDERKRLKTLLREMTAQGLLAHDRGKWLRRADQLPSVMVVRISGTDDYGDLMAEPERWEGVDPPPRIFAVEMKRRRGRALGPGDRALVRLEAASDAEGSFYTARIIRTLPGAPETVLGRYEGGPEGGRITPTDRKIKRQFVVEEGADGGAQHGALVLADVERGRGRLGLRRARIIESLGDLADPRAISLIAIHHNGIPHKFDHETLAEAAAARPASLGRRVDLRDLRLITIDPADARDHDDAVFAEADPDEGNPGGWHLVVAIADVAHYVRPGSALDKEAFRRGNSCYFPDRVVPMLPESLSGDLCSLVSGQDRPAMAAHLWIDAKGNLKRYRFERAMVRSKAALNYTETQGAIEGDVNAATEGLVASHLKPLYGAYAALAAARKHREPLDLEMPERRVELDDEGNVASVALRPRFDSHRLVEEFMIAANVAAAKCLEKHRAPCIYRVHEEPSLDKLESLRSFLASLKLKLARGQVMRPALFNALLSKSGNEYRDLLSQVILRSQTQAYYSPEAQGHFGLALPRYAHFTSPIRRYADLVVHRSLVSALKLGDDGLRPDTAAALDEVSEHISQTERRAMAAERESNDRYLAAYLADRVGDVFEGQISGVTRFGLFVTLEPSGADGIIPISTLYDDYYVYDEDNHCLSGRKTGQIYRLADKVAVRLHEADPLTGSLRLELVDQTGLPAALTKPGKRPAKGRRSKARRR